MTTSRREFLDDLGAFAPLGLRFDRPDLLPYNARVVGLGGRTIVPGFIDARTHPAVAGRMHLRQVDCDLRSIAAIQAAIRERVAKTPPGQWVLGFKYDDPKTAEGRPLTRADLRSASRTPASPDRRPTRL